MRASHSQKNRRYPVIKEVSRSPDTARNTSAFGPNIGSIRLTRTPQEMMTLYQQVTKSDLFDSVGSVGGFWTLLNGIFLIICGRGLLDVLIGMLKAYCLAFIDEVRQVNVLCRQSGGCMSLIGNGFRPLRKKPIRTSRMTKLREACLPSLQTTLSTWALSTPRITEVT